MAERVFVAVMAVFASSFAQQPEVTTSLGPLKGLKLKSNSGREYHSFEGIPFAEPPVGKHRFKQAVPSSPWTGTLNATRAPPMCMQMTKPSKPSDKPILTDVTGSEDCLYLNVYRPKLVAEPSSDELLNVLVLIHGGGYQQGYATLYGPSYIMDRDVVMVSINYRLGILGFLSFEDSVVPGNNALKDQSLALRWIKTHIAAFGGDPNKVTIAGVSAGGSSVHSHMISPMSKGLFHKAISNSGTALSPWAVHRTPRKIGLFMAETVGCPINDTDITLECLQQRTAEQIVSASARVTDYKKILFPFAPVIEPPGPNAFMDKPPIDMIISKEGSDVPALFSNAVDEGAFFLSKPYFYADHAQEYDNDWNQNLPQIASFDGIFNRSKEEEIAQIIRKRFLGNSKLSNNLNGFAKILGERHFVDSIQKSSLLHAEHQESPVYAYRFDFNRPKGYIPKFDSFFGKINYTGGATHGEDYLYIFNTFMAEDVNLFPEAHAMMKTMTDIWMKFIMGDQLEEWKPVDLALPKWTFLDITSPHPKENIFKAEEPVGQFWDTLNIPLEPARLKLDSQNGM